MSWHLPTRTYVTRRTAEGLSKPEVIRCLKRYLAREPYRTLVGPQLRASGQPTVTTPSRPLIWALDNP